MSTIGIDIGGTKIAGGILSWPDRAIEHLARIPTPVDGAESVLRAVETMIAELRELDDSVSAIGVGAPGLIGPGTGRVAAASTIVPGWEGADVGARLRERTGLPVVVENDVRAMARAEAAFGAGRELGRVLYLSVGTGVGGAIGCGTRIVGGAHGTAGEIAHLTVALHGPVPCGCGAFDHLESILAGPALEAAYAEETGRIARLPEIAQKVAQDGGGAELLSQQIAEAGRTIGGFAAACDIDAIVVAGGVARTGRLLLDPLEQGIGENSWPRGRPLPVHPAELGADAALIGAGLLGTEHPADLDEGNRE